jgi:branched-chain amino acid transport system substrate-binding protein
MNDTTTLPRRSLLTGAAALAAAPLARPALAQGAPVRIGLMLPFSGTFASLGENIAAAFEMYLAEKGGRLTPTNSCRLSANMASTSAVEASSR